MAQHVADGDTSALTGLALGAKVVDSLMGDLTGEGRDDALLVVDPARGGGEDARHPLEVVLMRRDADGRLRRAAANPRLLNFGLGVAAGDRLRADAGSFTVVDAGDGGGAVRAEYRFDYDRHTREWRVAHLLRFIVDPHTRRERRQELDAHDLGRVAVARFDPARLPAFPEEKSK